MEDISVGFGTEVATSGGWFENLAGLAILVLVVAKRYAKPGATGTYAYESAPVATRKKKGKKR